jgi:uncharacterized membrane protein
MNRIISQPMLDRLFRIGISIKGLDGLLEVLGGATLLVAPLGRLQGVVAAMATREIAEDKHAAVSVCAGVGRFDRGGCWDCLAHISKMAAA